MTAGSPDGCEYGDVVGIVGSSRIEACGAQRYPTASTRNTAAFSSRSDLDSDKPRMPRETINARFERLRRSKSGSRKNRIRKERVREVLALLGRDHADLADAVWALLDDSLPSQFSALTDTHRFSDGASTAHIACHVGILQRGTGKLDREGRDYWIKPLREMGAVEPITLPRWRDRIRRRSRGVEIS